MAEAQTCEVAATLAPRNSEHWNDLW